MHASRFAPQLLVGLLVATIAGCGTSTTSPIPATQPAAPTGIAAATSGVPATAVPPLPAALPALAPPPIDLTAVPARLHVDSVQGASAWIGPAGGTITTSASDGTTYELDVPPLAVGNPTPITMTPVASIDTLGLSGGLAGAVYVGPTGLKLAEPATLRITTTKPTPAGMRLVGFDVADDGVTTDLVAAAATGAVQAVNVTHFSSPGVGFGTSEDLQLLQGTAVVQSGGNMAARLSALLALPTPWTPAEVTEGLVLIIDAHVDIMDPELRQSSSDADLLNVISDWQTFVLMMNVGAHDGDVAAALADGLDGYTGGIGTLKAYFIDDQVRLGNLIGKAVDGNKALCLSTHDLPALANSTYWAALGEQYDPIWGDWGAEARGCATVVMTSFNPPTNLRAGGSDSFQISFGLEFHDGTKVNGDFVLALQGSRFSFTSSGNPSATAGEVSSSIMDVGVAASADPPYQLGVSACWSLDGVVRDLCSEQLFQSFGPGASSGTGQGGNQPPPPPQTPPTSTGFHFGDLFVGKWTICNRLGRCYEQPGAFRAPVYTVVPDWELDLPCFYQVADTATYRFRFPDLASFTAIGVGSDSRFCSQTPTLRGSLDGATITLTLTNRTDVDLVYKFSGTFVPYKP
ncbi:MAG TPA: hypothetical protein VFE15_11895 [Marmoricola sp.]|jgi:hypothetical protein|nr:hypothetical protein [Marmoricola sp.]